ncbi:hypothetical protein CYMTET_20905, partial [Cymbomonas tetramitiformis]
MATDVEIVEPLRYGDFISLRSAGTVQGFMLAEGTFHGDVCLAATPLCFDQSLFQICGRRVYSAAQELAAFVKSHQSPEPSGGGEEFKEDEHEEEENSTKTVHEALTRSRDNEEMLNESLELRQFDSGQTVRFGDQVQLRHVNSGRYLTVSTSEVAEAESENIKVFLDTDGSNHSHVAFEP